MTWNGPNILRVGKHRPSLVLRTCDNGIAYEVINGAVDDGHDDTRDKRTPKVGSTKYIFNCRSSAEKAFDEMESAFSQRPDLLLK